jgi:hypothetical protein
MPGSCSSLPRVPSIRVQIYGLLRLLLEREALELSWQERDTVGSALEKCQAALPVSVNHRCSGELTR